MIFYIIETIEKAFNEFEIEHEIFVVDDNSSDNTKLLLGELQKKYTSLRFETNSGPNGFGYTVRYGLERFNGDCVAIMMADLSDSPYDLIKFYKIMIEGNYDCVFGSRFIKGGKLIDYPFVKKIINRIANFIISSVMQINYNDTTNAFKLFKRHAIEGIKPLLSPHFNLT